MFFGGIRWRIWATMIVVVALLLRRRLQHHEAYQKERIIMFLNSDRDPLGTGYQVTQAKIAIGSGGIHGKGFSKGTQATSVSFPRGTPISSSPSSARSGGSSAWLSCSVSIFSHRPGLHVREKSARPRRHIPGDLPDLVLRLPHVHQRGDADRRVADDRHPAATDLYGGSSTMMFLMAIGLMLNVDMRRFGATSNA